MPMEKVSCLADRLQLMMHIQYAVTMCFFLVASKSDSWRGLKSSTVLPVESGNDWENAMLEFWMILQ